MKLLSDEQWNDVNKKLKCVSENLDSNMKKAMKEIAKPTKEATEAMKHLGIPGPGASMEIKACEPVFIVGKSEPLNDVRNVVTLEYHQRTVSWWKNRSSSWKHLAKFNNQCFTDELDVTASLIQDTKMLSDALLTVLDYVRDSDMWNRDKEKFYNAIERAREIKKGD